MTPPVMSQSAPSGPVPENKPVKKEKGKVDGGGGRSPTLLFSYRARRQKKIKRGRFPGRILHIQDEDFIPLMVV